MNLNYTKMSEMATRTYHVVFDGGICNYVPLLTAAMDDFFAGREVARGLSISLNITKNDGNTSTGSFDWFDLDMVCAVFDVNARDDDATTVGLFVPYSYQENIYFSVSSDRGKNVLYISVTKRVF